MMRRPGQDAGGKKKDWTGMEAAFVALIGTGQIGAERSRFQDGNPSVPVFDLDLDDAETLLNPLSAGLAEIATMAKTMAGGVVPSELLATDLSHNGVPAQSSGIGSPEQASGADGVLPDAQFAALIAGTSALVVPGRPNLSPVLGAEPRTMPALVKVVAAQSVPDAIDGHEQGQSPDLNRPQAPTAIPTGRIPGPDAAVPPTVPPGHAAVPVEDGAPVPTTSALQAVKFAEIEQAKGQVTPGQMADVTQQPKPETVSGPSVRAKADTPHLATRDPVVLLQKTADHRTSLAEFALSSQTADNPVLPATVSIEYGRSASAVPVGHAAPEARTARHVAQQIAAEVTSAEDGRTDILLDPKELGRVRLSLQANDQTITLVILTERPETADLMRRHIDQLAQEFRTLGYQDVRFTFESQSDQRGDRGQGDETPPERDARDVDATGGTADLSPRSPGRTAIGQLDLRL
jgi:flagellar hook-length control protein FliK